VSRYLRGRERLCGFEEGERIGEIVHILPVDESGSITVMRERQRGIHSGTRVQKKCID
jgi:hypothetical protein